MRAQDLLPDHIDMTQVNGINVRKGTVGAFLINARIWLSPDFSGETKAKAEADIIEALPALGALGLFDLMTPNDVQLRGLVEDHTSGTPA